MNGFNNEIVYPVPTLTDHGNVYLVLTVFKLKRGCAQFSCTPYSYSAIIMPQGRLAFFFVVVFLQGRIWPSKQNLFFKSHHLGDPGATMVKTTSNQAITQSCAARKTRSSNRQDWYAGAPKQLNKYCINYDIEKNYVYIIYVHVHVVRIDYTQRLGDGNCPRLEVVLFHLPFHGSTVSPEA